MEIQKCYQKETKFNGIYLRKSLYKIKDGANIVNLDDYESLETYWITLYVNAKNITYFDSFWVENISKKIRKSIKNITTNIYRIQAYDSILCGYFCIGFIDFMLKVKSYSIQISFFLTNIKRMTKHLKFYFVNRFLKRLRWDKSVLLSVKSINNSKSLKVVLTSVEVLMKKNLRNRNQ